MGQVTLDNKYNIQYEDDFLTVFSALGSSQVIKRPNIMDIMFVIDISGSMGRTEDKEKIEENFKISPIVKTVNALNECINNILKTNKKTRIGIAVYGATATILLPLDNYSIIDNIPFIETSYIETYGINQGAHFSLKVTAKNSNSETIIKYADNSGSKSADTHGTSNLTNAHINGTSGITEGNGTEDSHYHVGHITNQQAGLAAGLDELATAENTTWKSNSGKTQSNIPCMIHLTDGQASDFSTLEDNYNWNNVNINKDIAYNTIIKDINKYNVNQISDAAISIPMVFQTLMTASYYTSKVNNHYRKNAIESNVEGGDNISIINYAVYASDVAKLDEMEDGLIKDVIKSICDPSNNFLSTDKSEIITGETYGEGAYKLFEKWKNGQNVNNTYSNDKISVTLNANKNQLIDDKYGITEKDIIENIYYIKEGNFLSTGFDTLNEVIIKIIEENTLKVVNPIRNNPSDLKNSNKLSYVDPIGKYMQVKDISKLLLFGKQYDIIESQEPEIEQIGEKYVEKHYYKPVSSEGEDLQINNLSYGQNIKFKLSDIKIRKEITKSNDIDNEETIYIDIPRNALPIKVDTIEIDQQENIVNYESNVNTDNSLPIRVIYTVGINDEIMKENKIDFEKISEDYLSKNKEIKDGKEYTYFYSNYYSNNFYNNETESTEGNAYVSFIPALENGFYISQKNLIIYKNSSGGDSNGEGVLSETGGNVSLSNEIKDFKDIKENETYYFATDYYMPLETTGNTNVKGKLIKYAVSIKGTDLYDKDNKLSLTYYNTKTKSETSTQGNDTVVATKIGERGLLDISKISIDKEQNETSTASKCTAPKYLNDDEINIIENLGNNGKLLIPGESSPTSNPNSTPELPSTTKQNENQANKPKNILPKAGDKKPIIILTLALDICIGIFFYIKYRKFKDI